MGPQAAVGIELPEEAAGICAPNWAPVFDLEDGLSNALTGAGQIGKV